MELVDISKVIGALPKIEVGLKKYLSIMGKFQNTNVSNDIEFQKEFNGFYRIRQRKPEFYKCFYTYLEDCKNMDISFDKVITHFYEKLNRIESSFSSKLIATVNPNMPVWDSMVLNNLGLKKPSYGSVNRLSKTIELYNYINEWYMEFSNTQNAKEIICLFDNMYPTSMITDIKKIDLVLWQIRD